jgi:TonB-dependent SusC/RagA subfamily outer membrane receptor
MRLATAAVLILSAACLGAQTSITTGAILGTVSSDSVKRAAVRSVSEMLTARIPGVQTFTRDGQVGVGSVAYVRGLSGDPALSEPLLFIDGIRGDGRSAVPGPGVGGELGTSRLNDIDPAEIARVDVVTGPAAAVYGSGSANGVILVTTKQSDGGRPRVDISAEGGLTTTPLRDGQSYYAWGNGGTQCLTYQRAAGQCTVDSITHFNPLLANSSAITGTGYLQRYVASVGGGLAANALRYMVTGNYSDELGTLELPAAEQSYYQSEYHADVPSDVRRPNAMDAAGVRGSLLGTVGSVADLSLTLGYLGNHQRSTDDGTVLQDAALTPGYQEGDGWGPNPVVHPADIFAERGTDNVRRFTGSLHGDWHPASIVRAFFTAGVDNVDETQGGNYTSPMSAPYLPLQFDANARALTERSDASGGVTIGGAIARGLTSHLTIGGEYTEDHFRLADVARETLEQGAITVMFDQASHARAQIGSGYVEDAVTIDDRLFVTGGVRVDDMRIYPYFSTTAVNGFVNATLVPLPVMAPLLKLHGGYSTSSQAPTAEQMATQDLAYPALYPVQIGTGYPVPFTEVGPQAPREQDIELGMAAGGWHGRLTADLTVYERRTARALIPLDFNQNDGSGVYDLVQYELNGGVVRNRGIEGRVSAQLIDQPAVGWDATLLASGNQNRLLKFPLPLDAANGLGQMSGYPLNGVWATPYTYNDANGDGAISPGEVSGSGPAKYVGSSVPTREASLATGVRLFHRRLRLAALVDYRGGYVLPDLAGWYRALTGSDPALNDLPSSLGRQAQALAAGFVPDGWYQHVEAFRWREMSATVTVQRFDVTLAARNLALWTNYRGNDPDMDWTTGSGLNATTLRLPPPRTFLIRVATSI